MQNQLLLKNLILKNRGFTFKMKENKQRYGVKILKTGILFYKINSKFFEDYMAEYVLDFKTKLDLKQFKIGS